MSIMVIGREDVRRALDYKGCIALMRSAMTALSRGEAIYIPRQIVQMGDGRLLAVMPGGLGGSQTFGVKVISVYPDNHARGMQSHQGPVALFDPEIGALAAIVHAGEITAIRTASASAAATDALARKDASTLAIIGYGEQGMSHVRAISEVRKLTRVTIWGRDADRRRKFAESASEAIGVECVPADSPAEGVRDADIICTVTAAAEPVLFGRDVAPGTHVNVVGSSFAGPAEIDNDLVAKSRFFADYTPHVLAQGAEFIRAREAGVIDESHLLGEVGEIFDGSKAGRIHDDDITIYKSLGHIVQDLTSGWYVYQRAKEEGWGSVAPF